MEPVIEAHSIDYLHQHSLFLFDAEAAKRMSLVRMKNNWTQKFLADQFGCKQNIISRIELGQIKFNEHITVFKMQVYLGKAWRYVIYGANQAMYDEQRITKNYWQGKFKKQGRNHDKY